MVVVVAVVAAVVKLLVLLCVITLSHSHILTLCRRAGFNNSGTEECISGKQSLCVADARVAFGVYLDNGSGTWYATGV